MNERKKHKSGFVNIIGNPNVGKSTLMNHLVGERLSIITSKAQTTRHRILGIVSEEDYQIVFSDTPGVIKPAYEMQEGMMSFVRQAFQDADVLLYMVEIGDKILKDATFMHKIKTTDIPVLLLINKIDRSNQEKLIEEVTHWKETLPKAEIIPISALEGFNIETVKELIIERLPESPAFYPKEALTDKPERFFVNEAIREKILLNYKKEIPYSVEVETDLFKEDEKMIRIHANVYVERNSQKGIIIGHQGKMLKKTATEARLDLEKFFQKKIFLELFVKVNKDWRKNKKQLKRFGYEN
ncbi:MAG: GTPase Era [Flavobacteriales bacterium]